MACTRKKQCLYGDICPTARSNEYNLINASCYKPLEQNNEEYIKSCTTEELAEFLLDVWYGIDDVINIMEREDVGKKEAMLIWLKEKYNA